MMKRYVAVLALLTAIVSSPITAQRIYHSNAGEIIFSGADVNYSGVNVNTNIRFTLFFHTQHHINLDLTNNIGLYTGLGIRNVGLITEDLYQNMGFLNIDNTHPDYNKNTKIKRRSYSLGFPVALKLGSISKHFFLFGGYEWEWMFHYKQKLYIDDEKFKFREWTSDRVNPWVPSVFGGIQFPQGFRLKFKYYLDDFLNPAFTGVDFGEDVDYSQFQSSGMWYVSVAFFINKKQIQKWIGGGYEESAYRY
ncbi:MAG: hypothetical protein KAT15_01900 [Bacteroidales bacterium]|nr:hypothetical protein [Bacteroidales bacterium]